MVNPYIFAFAFILDLLMGDPVFIYHPVSFMGRVISIYEKVFRKLLPKKKSGEILGGLLTVLFTVFTVFSVYMAIRIIFYKISLAVGIFCDVFLSSQMLAAKCLKQSSMKVYTALTESLQKGREAVSMIVGRDTDKLNEEQVIKAAVETVAENTSDGEIAPMFYLFLFGPMGAITYKTINTMDSMLGYKNDKYINFGFCAAKLDDIANFIPARLGAFFMILSSFILKLNGKNALDIFMRDRNRHKSPNSGQLESVAAGALGIKLGGDSYYFGQLSHKETLGDETRKAEKDDIIKANKLMYLSSFLAFMWLMLISILFMI